MSFAPWVRQKRIQAPPFGLRLTRQASGFVLPSTLYELQATSQTTVSPDVSGIAKRAQPEGFCLFKAWRREIA